MLVKKICQIYLDSTVSQAQDNVGIQDNMGLMNISNPKNLNSTKF
jgi:hypothetical protein